MAHRLAYLVVTLTMIGALMQSSPAGAQNRRLYPLPGPEVPASLGVNIHFTTPREGEMEQLADAGFKWIRMDFSWSGIERQKGVYDFSAYDRLQSALKRHGIRAIFILDYGNDLYQEGSPRTPEARAAFARFAAAAVSHFANQGILWEMWNEPNIFFWRPKPSVDEYVALAREVGEAIRKTAPEEWYIGPATSTIDMAFLEKCFQAGLLEYWDAVSVHPYRNTPPETSTPEVRKLRQLVDRYAPKGKSIPLISGEWGYSELYSGLNLDKQGKYLPREFLTNLANHVIVSIWYDWHDDGTDPKEVEHHFGTVYPDYRPKPAYRAAQTLSRTLQGYRFSKRLALESPDDYCLLFTRGSESRLAVWTTAAEARDVSLPVSAGSFRVVSYTGEATTAQAGPSGLSLRLTDAPQYLEPEGRNELLSLAAAWKELPPQAPLTGAGSVLSVLSSMLRGGTGAASGGRAAEVSLLNPDTGDRATLPAEASGRELSALVGRVLRLQDRGEQPQRLRVALSRAGSPALRQELDVVATNPLRITPLPPSGDRLPVRVENLAASRFDGRLSVAGVPGSQRLVRLRSEDREAVVDLPVGPNRSGAYAARLILEERRGSRFAPVLTTPSLELVTLEGFASYPLGGTLPPDRYRVVEDGDATVKASIDASVEAPPPGLPGEATKALRIHWDFQPGWKFLRLVPQGDLAKPLEGEPYALGLWVHSDGSGDLLRARFTDSTGQTFQPDGGPLDWRGWRYVTIPLRADAAGRWGGADDGVVHPPIHLDSLLLVDSPGGRGGHGTLYVTGVTLVRRPSGR